MSDTFAKKRIDWIDIAKGIGILLVILGHVSLGNGFSHYIHAFHMPLFFFISGFLYPLQPKGTEIGYIRRKARTLLLPYVVFGLLTYGVWLLTQLPAAQNGEEIEYLEPLFHLFWINSTGLVISGEFWFLTALFVASVLFDFLQRRCRRQSVVGVIVLLVALFGCLFRRLFDIQLPFSMLSGFVGLGLMFLGYMFKRWQEHPAVNRMLNARWYELLTATILLSLLIFVNGEINMRRSLYAIVPLFWLNATGMSLVLLILSQRIEQGLCRGAFRRCVSVIKNIGRDSIVYVCLDSMVLKTISAVQRMLFPMPPIDTVCWVLLGIVEAAIATAILYVLNLVIQKTKLRMLFGKF